MFLSLVLSSKHESELGLFLLGILLFIDYRQMLGIGNKKAFWLTVKTGLFYVLVAVLFYTVITVGLVGYAFLSTA